MKTNKIYELVRKMEEANELEYDIGHRGGTYGARAAKVIDALGMTNVSAEMLPNKTGVYCNYLGGGLRGTVNVLATASEMVAHGVPKNAAKKIEAFAQACKQRYEEIEQDWANDEGSFTDEWSEAGTAMNRAAGVVSAY